MRKPVELAAKHAAWLEHAADFVHICEDYVAAGDVLEHGIGINKVEGLVGELRQAGAIGGVRVGMRDIAQTLARQPDHFVRHIHAVNLG